jgi:hypothetical protein
LRQSKDRYWKSRTRPIGRTIIDYEDIGDWMILSSEARHASANSKTSVVTRDGRANARMLLLIHFLGSRRVHLHDRVVDLGYRNLP